MKKKLLFFKYLTIATFFLIGIDTPVCLAADANLVTLLGESPNKKLSKHKADIGLAHGQHPGRNGQLTAAEFNMAKIAWQYFELNYQPNTGLVNATNGYPSTTLWDVASYLAALVSAYELGVIPKPEFDSRLSKILTTFNSISFFRNALPHKVYHTKTLEKMTYANKPGEIGFSALDLGRLLIWLKIIKERYPDYSNAIDTFVLRWDFSQLLDKNGSLYGASRNKASGEIMPMQEGRFGYEEYCAKGFNLWGFDTGEAAKAEPYDSVQIYGIDIPFDSRNPKQYYAQTAVVSESYILDALEFNWDLANDTSGDDSDHSHPWMAEVAKRIYQVQEQRYKQTGMLTARTEHHIDQKPYFVYDSIYSDGHPWSTITESSIPVPQFAAVSLKGALGLWAIWKTDYTDLLFSKFSKVYEPDKGFYEGVYEDGSGAINQFTANNNGIILEALLYKVQGKLLRFSGHSSLWDKNKGRMATQ